MLLRISCQSVLISRKISGIFYAKSREKYMEFAENNEEFEGKLTRNLKEKHREFFTRGLKFNLIYRSKFTYINNIPFLRPWS
jgi:hypothetical protein